MEEFGRLVLAASLAAALVLAVVGVRALIRRIGFGRSRSTAADLAERYSIDPGRPAILYVFDDGCAQCGALQEPALTAVSEHSGVVVRWLAATAEPELLKRFDIATFPSTVVLDPRHSVRGVNIGFADAATLQSQLA